MVIQKEKESGLQGEETEAYVQREVFKKKKKKFVQLSQLCSFGGPLSFLLCVL